MRREALLRARLDGGNDVDALTSRVSMRKGIFLMQRHVAEVNLNLPGRFFAEAFEGGDGHRIWGVGAMEIVGITETLFVGRCWCFVLHADDRRRVVGSPFQGGLLGLRRPEEWHLRREVDSDVLERNFFRAHQISPASQLIIGKVRAYLFAHCFLLSPCMVFEAHPYKADHREQSGDYPRTRIV